MAIQEKKVSVSIISKFIIHIMVLCRACKCEVDYDEQPPESPVSHLQPSMLDAYCTWEIGYILKCVCVLL